MDDRRLLEFAIWVGFMLVSAIYRWRKQAAAERKQQPQPKRTPARARHERVAAPSRPAKPQRSAATRGRLSDRRPLRSPSAAPAPPPVEAPTDAAEPLVVETAVEQKPSAPLLRALQQRIAAAPSTRVAGPTAKASTDQHTPPLEQVRDAILLDAILTRPKRSPLDPVEPPSY